MFVFSKGHPLNLRVHWLHLVYILYILQGSPTHLKNTLAASCLYLAGVTHSILLFVTRPMKRGGSVAKNMIARRTFGKRVDNMSVLVCSPSFWTFLVFPGNPTDSELRFTLEKELHGYFYFEQPNYDGKNPATSATEFFLLIGHLPHICPFWVGTNTGCFF